MAHGSTCRSLSRDRSAGDCQMRKGYLPGDRFCCKLNPYSPVWGYWMPNEADTCRKYVVPKLHSAGWDDDQIREQVTFTDGGRKCPR